MDKLSDWGIIGLGTIGSNLIINFSRNGFKLSIYNRHLKGLEENIAKNFVKINSHLENVLPFDNINFFVKSIKKPRKILILIPSGKPIDEMIESLLNYLSKEDIIIDGGNSYFKDTERRELYLKRKKLNFLGIGISGGTMGARNGPSIMVGGSKTIYKKVERDLNKISAITHLNESCCNRVGPSSSGHYVKMIHNGIEYVEMQLIAECYDFMKTEMQFDNLKISKVFKKWLKTSSKSYLLNISSEILKFKENGSFIIDNILDKSGDKGTGIWAAISGIELGVSNTLMTLALHSRYISFKKETRVKYSQFRKKKKYDVKISTNDLKLVYDFSRIINFYQGLNVLKAASKYYNWKLNLFDIISVWSNGSILKSELIFLLKKVLKDHADILNNEIIDKNFVSKYDKIKKIIIKSQNSNTPLLLISNSIIFFELITQKVGTGNLIQAQRDYFGSHGFNLKDSKRLLKNNWHNKKS
jgi:6-phosphogluconate dehydrogenase